MTKPPTLSFDGFGVNLKQFDDVGECTYAERVATLGQTFGGRSIGSSLGYLMAHTLELHAALQVAQSAMKWAESAYPANQKKIEDAQELVNSVVGKTRPHFDNFNKLTKLDNCGT